VDLVNGVGLKTAYFENQIFAKPIQSQLAQLAPQQKTMGPLVLTRSAEEHGGPHEAWFWDPTRQAAGCSQTWAATPSLSAGMPSPPSASQSRFFSRFPSPLRRRCSNGAALLA